MSFNLDNFYKYSIHIKSSKINNDILVWFIGFTEGDGSFQADFNTKRNFFIINQKDPKVLYKIKKILGFGTVKFYPKQGKEGIYRFIVTDQKGTFLLIQLFNGNIILDKVRERFKLYLELFNSLEKKKLDDDLKFFIDFNINIPLCSFKNSWLSGFIDAEGSFNIRSHFSTNKTPTIRPSDLRFSLTQLNASNFFNYLCLNYPDFLSHPFSNKRNNQIIYDRVSLNGLKVKLIIDYLNSFPLYSEKSISFKKFKKIYYRLIDNKNHSTPKAKKRLKRLINTVSSLTQTSNKKNLYYKNKK